MELGDEAIFNCGRPLRERINDSVVEAAHRGREIGDVNPMARTDDVRTDEYRDQAAECLDSDRSVADAKAKLELLVLAKGYLDLADLVEGSANEYGGIARWGGSDD